MDLHPRQQETNHARHQLLARYGIPHCLLLSTVPDILRAVDDDVIFPLSDAWTGHLWARVGNLDALSRACFRAREVLAGKTLKLFVMPYLSLKDAFDLHLLIDNPGEIADPNQPVPARHGLLMLADPDAPDDASELMFVAFDIINYSLLRSKADQHQIFLGAVGDIEMLMGNLNNNRNQVLNNPALNSVLSPEAYEQLEAASHILQEELVVSLYMDGMNPHDVISDLDSEAHDQIYDHVSDPCINPDAPPYELTDEFTRARLETYVQQLVVSGRNARQPMDACLAVLEAEGNCHARFVRSQSSKSLRQIFEIFDKCNEDLLALIQEINSADKRLSLLGVNDVEGGILPIPPPPDA